MRIGRFVCGRNLLANSILENDDDDKDYSIYAQKAAAFSSIIQPKEKYIKSFISLPYKISMRPNTEKKSHFDSLVLLVKVILIFMLEKKYYAQITKIDFDFSSQKSLHIAISWSRDVVQRLEINAIAVFPRSTLQPQNSKHNIDAGSKYHLAHVKTFLIYTTCVKVLIYNFSRK
ncbi:hypothetical protein BpHYR1_037080 [Brachionus plicatilis]|uniref:Uncharacterized protein n=1 Tax=Brachionus plicatilis TaxID=10195 RepID=A0A3M7SBJ2_BRAPC|nr:hypothetical protein BpHYR1_037080 [Brachionus plicatilis]